ncbi:hypothetical protein M413DRAFT_29736 [Hebeloma cylindrosporum]|uniref:Integrase catalytic domain-containing protein n=1 Tax=Hebeloma cylindrosporum TaxID=76867 RepID=A0A0C2XM25_HEBCY|nr:hypothetical protein M413DRAFT_29736 [Hebeloma cylindrosporum h7]
MSDNAPMYLKAVGILIEKYKMGYIKISPYNSKAQGPIERRHFNVHESIMKACEGDESHWPTVAPSVFWAECVTIRKATGYSPFYIAHGIQPLLPFNLAEATYLCPDFDKSISTEELIARRAIMLQKCPEDLEHVCLLVLKL